ncbi:MAG: DEAD/DEAH box helicase family protein [Ignavibacteriales bacterium]|nr:DEAD/DEAH box helicase family protein [Ignavibacteriales bacterium]MCF8316466.1 DEAD/DEAH box helicase family protein [Ignavibacteriales bacterium]MCF8437946.1 DEAD/DEAH box helicase family protein [Ignavibacteriales bacterium]
MKLKFKQQQYQYNATMAVVNCFAGQKKGERKELIGRTGFLTDEIFSNRKFDLTPEEILKNIQEVQRDQGLKVSKTLEGFNFTTEMETGTGKTYVYTKTMYELNAHYGWSKFIIMVPSVAIREGVHKSLEITADHFQEIYGKKIRFTVYNTQKKSNLVNIKSFANTSNIEVIIMNYQAFGRKSKESLKIYQKLDSLQSEKPIDILKRTRPILIIDEPQRFGPQAESLLHEFNPLFNLRYSATHKYEYNKIYRLDAIDAYNHKLVKKINVKGIEVTGNTGTNSYLFLDRIQISTKYYPAAYIEMEVDQKSGIKKIIKKISEKDDLYQLSGELSQYKGFIVKEINGKKNRVAFTNGVEIYAGQASGDVDEEHLRRIQIRETIKSHLEKERKLYGRGIKVLSLFFIDEVAKYRLYDDNNNEIPGEYARVFEEEYSNAIQEQRLFEDEYNKYLELHQPEKIHKGYFSIDKKGRLVNSSTKRGEEESDDESAYELIMKNKERLLSLSEPTRFIFSHSALREGWDNPNVFQICTLKHSQSTIGKRQEIGRGLRICVNNNGERMDVSVLENDFFDMNTLTVIASESYDSFAKQLQTEIVESLSERPAKLTIDVLKGRILKNNAGKKIVLDDQKTMDLIFTCRDNGYVDKEYKITEKMIEDIEKDKVVLPEELKEFKEPIVELMQSIYTTANFKATEDDRENNISEAELKPNENFAKKEFQDLWNKIKIKTVYEVDFNSNELIEKSINAINAKLEVKKVLVTITEGEQKDQLDEISLKSGNSMIKKKDIAERTESLLGALKYDLVAEIARETNLTRKTIVKILQGLKELVFANFRVNPESFIREVSKLINSEKAATLINNITYSKLEESYDDTIFTVNNFKGSLSKNIIEVKKHIYNYLRYDSAIERDFAADLEAGEVFIYAKLPGGFKIPTPVGNYNPDWAIVFDTTEFKYVYFIAETKGSMESLELRSKEEQKIDYARKHFEALGDTNIKYDVITSYKDLRDRVMR